MILPETFAATAAQVLPSLAFAVPRGGGRPPARLRPAGPRARALAAGGLLTAYPTCRCRAPSGPVGARLVLAVVLARALLGARPRDALAAPRVRRCALGGW